MKNQRISGIGCFAKPETLTRVFKTMMQNYTLGPLEDSELFNGQETRGTDGTELLKALIAAKAGPFQSPSAESASGLKNKKITGFFLALRDQQLNLSVFAKGEGPGQQRYTASLDEFTKMRQKRLN